MIEVVSIGRRTVRLRPSLARGVRRSLVIATGGSEGREGPIIQIGAAFASSLARAGNGLARARADPDGVRDGRRRGRRVQHADRRDALRARGRRRVVLDDALRPGGRRPPWSRRFWSAPCSATSPSTRSRRSGSSRREFLPFVGIGLLAGAVLGRCSSASLSLGEEALLARRSCRLGARMALGGAIVGAIGDRRCRRSSATASRRPTASSTGTRRSSSCSSCSSPEDGRHRRRRSAPAASAASSRRRCMVGAALGGSVARIVQLALPAPRGAGRRLRAPRHGRHAGRHDAGAAARRHHDLRADAEHGGPAADDGRLGPRGRRRASPPEGLDLRREPALGGHRLGEDARGDGARDACKVSDIMRRDVALIPRYDCRCRRSSPRSCARGASSSTSATKKAGCWARSTSTTSRSRSRRGSSRRSWSPPRTSSPRSPS